MLFFDAHKMSICPICKLQAAINQIDLSKLDFYMFYIFCPMYWIENKSTQSENTLIKYSYHLRDITCQYVRQAIDVTTKMCFV